MKSQRGMTFVEVLVSMSIISVLVVSSLQVVTATYKSTKDNINKQFATQKAMAILEELRTAIQTQTGSAGATLDTFDDGVTNKPMLTIQTGLKSPAEAVSGNTPAGSHWLYERHISVRKMPGQSNDIRLVTVKVYVNENGGPRLLAEVASILNTVAEVFPPTQEYDVYCIAIENIPGWWVYMANIVPFVEGAIQDLEARHPGLKFRTHWIRKLSYGRDQLYRPYINRSQDSVSDINSVYFYPGTMPTGSAVNEYYPPEFFSAKINIDGTPVNDYAADTNPLPYALADQYNHALRYADERRLFQDRVQLGLERADEPTLRLLLDDMYMNPQNYKNAILINLHGELFPFPPVRNYSDPAKDAAAYPYVRAVTHPEQIRYQNTDSIGLRVYSYETNLDSSVSVPPWLGRNSGTPVPVTLVLKEINWFVTAGDIKAITGGVDFDGDGSPDPYNLLDAPASSKPTSAPTSMWYSSQIIGNDTVIRLYNTPLSAPCVTAPKTKKTNPPPCGLGGLNEPFYGLDYIPSPVEDLTGGAVAFSTNLTTAGTTPKNSARWIITIPASVLPNNGVIRVETRIGEDLLTGRAIPPINGPSNLSSTYAWRGTDLWIFGDANTPANLPVTERYQVLGDPRHSPYADLKRPHQGSGYVTQNRLGMGYNRYFDDFHNNSTNARSTWAGYSYDSGGVSYGIENNASDNSPTNDGWSTGGGPLEIDMPRIFQMMRESLARTNAVYTTMTGFSYFYAGIGGEIGYDAANNFANSIPVSRRPFDGNSGRRFEQSILGQNNGRAGVKYIREGVPGSEYWWGASWLGELYPDTAYSGTSGWLATGNLPAGLGAGQFIRALRGDITPRLPAGTSLLDSVRRTAEEGSTAFFWSGTPNATFHHQYANGSTATLGTEGAAISTRYKLQMVTPIANDRPFGLQENTLSYNPDHFLQAPYGTVMTLRNEALFYRNIGGLTGSSLVSMQGAGNDAAFVVVNGLSPTGISGTGFISRWSFLSLIESFFHSGQYRQAGSLSPARVRQLPRVAITNPNPASELKDPASIDVTWSVDWSRWDQSTYADSYPAGFAENTPLIFVPMYSRDNGITWLHMTDNSAAVRGLRPTDSAHFVTTPNYSWSVPSHDFPEGNYLIRIEAYRSTLPLHYAHHQFRAFIDR